MVIVLFGVMMMNVCGGEGGLVLVFCVLVSIGVIFSVRLLFVSVVSFRKLW